jgi:hypothetical protein
MQSECCEVTVLDVDMVIVYIVNVFCQQPFVIFNVCPLDKLHFRMEPTDNHFC